MTKYISSINGLEIAGQCSNAIEALDVLQHKAIDVIFLDIKMPRIIGTEFLKNLSHPPKVIFVTAYREYAVDGFELDAVDYLVKPVSFERFFKAITKLTRMMGHEIAPATTNESFIPSAFVYLKVDRDMKKVFINDIAYIESWKDYVKVFFAGGGITWLNNPLLRWNIFYRNISLSGCIGHIWFRWIKYPDIMDSQFKWANRKFQ